MSFFQLTLSRKMYPMEKAMDFGVLLEEENKERFFGWLTCI